jgi:hypothetical protein
MPLELRLTSLASIRRSSNKAGKSSFVTLREPMEYEDAPLVSSASIADSICASRDSGDAMHQLEAWHPLKR